MSQQSSSQHQSSQQQSNSSNTAITVALITAAATVIAALVTGIFLLASKGATTSQTPHSSQAGVTTISSTPQSMQSIYEQAISGLPILNDPLTGQDANNWDADYNCEFTGIAYHAIIQRTTYLALCFAHATNFSNFAFQVQMTIIKGGAGGLIFRANTSGSEMYRFEVEPDGHYELISTDASNSVGRLTGTQYSTAIKTGLNQFNILTVIARENHIYLYINGQYVNDAVDTTYSIGRIGLFAWDNGQPTEVVFSNAEVWRL